MSKYEDYAEVSKSYDETRVPIGLEILLGCLTAAGRPLSEIRLLDAGCGTGAYSRAVIGHVGHIDAVDLNEGMLSVARAKLAEEETQGRVAFHHGSIDALPFEDEIFDAVMINQVLHHLDPPEVRPRAAHHRVIAELFRVIRPGGVLVVNMTTHDQLRNGFWFYDLIPGAREACIARTLPTTGLINMLQKHGFVFVRRFAPLDDVMQGFDYFEQAGPLDERWRSGDSIWALAGEEGIAQAEAKVSELRDAGTLGAWMEERDARREGVGQFTFFLAEKQSDRLEHLDPDARALARYMSDLSEESYYAGWEGNLEYDLWHAVLEGPKDFGHSRITKENIERLKSLCEAAGGWIVFDMAEGEVFVPLKEWEKTYEKFLADGNRPE